MERAVGELARRVAFAGICLLPLDYHCLSCHGAVGSLLFRVCAVGSCARLDSKLIWYRPYEAEIAVGLYDFWLRRVERGLSQVERCMEHEISPMLENAFERRFCHGQLGTDISDFEVQHCNRVEQCINYLNEFFCRHQTNVLESESSHDALDLIGLVHDGLSTEMESPPATSTPPTPAIQDARTNLLWVDTIRSSPAVVTVDDVETDRLSEKQDICEQVMRQFSERYRLSAILAANAPRMRKGVRMRREPLRAKAGEKNSKTNVHKVSIHEHKVTGCDGLVTTELTAKTG